MSLALAVLHGLALAGAAFLLGVSLLIIVIIIVATAAVRRFGWDPFEW